MLPAAEMTGAVLGGRYRLLRQLAAGGMGTVFEAEHVEIGRRLALKLMQPQFAQSQDAVNRFRREAQIAGSLGHDNICEVVDFGKTDDGSHYMVMPLLKGASLAQVLRTHGPLPFARALDIGAQILSALAAVHEVGVVHRDLKPDNVFITRVGDRDDFVKVLDFGISKMTEAVAGEASLTRTGALLGTPSYMAPEQARGLRDQDHRVDVYATGVILYELLTGKRPFEGDSPNDVIVRICTETIRPPRELRPDVPPDVEALVMRAMERNRDARFADATSMRADLVTVLRRMAETSGQLSRLSMPSPSVETTAPRLHQVETVAVSAPAVSLEATTPFGVGVAAPSRTSSIPSPLARWRAWAVAGAGAVLLAAALIAILATRSNTPPAPTPATTAAPTPLPPTTPTVPLPVPAAPVTPAPVVTDPTPAPASATTDRGAPDAGVAARPWHPAGAGATGPANASGARHVPSKNGKGLIHRRGGAAFATENE